MKKFELITKIFTVLCFLTAFVYGVFTRDLSIIVKCAFGAGVCFLPVSVKVSPLVSVMFYLFLVGSVLVTELFHFYTLIPWWDTLLHGYSGIMLTAFGFELVYLVNGRIEIKPFFVGLFAFCFAMALGALWEIYEYSFDCMLGMNMQRFLSSDGELLSGQNALYDTMKDIIVDCLGALTAACVGVGIMWRKKGKESGKTAP